MKPTKATAVFFTAIFMLVCFYSVAAFAEENIPAWEYNKAPSSDYCSVRGDTNFDGSISSDDARVLLRIAVGLDPTDEELNLVADVDGDGKITASDARLLLRASVGLEDRPPHIKEEQVVLVSITCAQNGVSADVCAVCGKFYNKGVIPSRGHEADGWITVKKSTCKEEGYEEKRCKYCDLLLESRTVGKSSHSYSKKEYEKGPSCFYPVNVYRICKVCGYRLQEVEWPSGEHSYAWVEITAPTCTEPGLERKECTHCGEITDQTREKDSLGGHRLSSWKTTQTVSCATGTDGRMIRTCLVCKEMIDEQIIKAEHIQFAGTYHVVKEPTCQQQGLAQYTCSVCRQTVDVALEKTEHTPIDEPVTVNPTCVLKGSVSYTCSVCGTVTAEISALGHVYATNQDGTPKWVFDEETGRPVRICIRCDAKIYGDAPEGND